MGIDIEGVGCDSQDQGIIREGNGLTIRAVARQLRLSRNTVKKHMDECTIDVRLMHRKRRKKLDIHRAFAAYATGEGFRIHAC